MKRIVILAGFAVLLCVSCAPAAPPQAPAVPQCTLPARVDPFAPANKSVRCACTSAAECTCDEACFCANCQTSLDTREVACNTVEGGCLVTVTRPSGEPGNPWRYSPDYKGGSWWKYKAAAQPAYRFSPALFQGTGCSSGR